MRIEKAVLTDLDRIITVLDEATLKLLHKEIPQWKYPWYREEIEKELKYQYVVREQESIVAVFSLKQLHTCIFKATPGPEDCYLYRIAVLPEYQGKGIGAKILRFAQKLSIKQKINLYLNCYQGNMKLRQFYEKAGFFYQGDYSEEDYMVSVFHFLWQKETPAMNRFRNARKRRQKELRIAKWSLLAVLLVMLIISGVHLWNLNFNKKVPLNAAIVIENTVYWREEGTVLSELPSGVNEVGEIKTVLKYYIWPSKEMEAVGLSKKLKGEKVYVDPKKGMAYIKDESQNYITFGQELTITNNNYSNGFYDMLLNACSEKEVVPLMDIPVDYSIDQAIEDNVAFYKDNNSEVTSEGVEHIEAFMEKAKNKKNAYVRIGSFSFNKSNEKRFIDLFYYKNGYYLFSNIDPDIVNARFSYFTLDNNNYYEINKKVFMLSRTEEIDTSQKIAKLQSWSLPIFIDYGSTIESK